MAGEPKIYKVKNGDKLETIAKANKIRDWRRIWNAQKNRKLVSKRKRPEALERGDTLYIPASDDYVKVTEKAILNLNLDRNNRLVQRRRIESLIAAYERNISNFEAYMARCQKDIERYIKDLDGSRKTVKKISTTVDTVQGLTGLARGLKDIGSKAYKSTKLDGKELRDLNKAVEDAVKDKLFMGGIDASRKLLELTKGTVLEPVNIINESWDKVNSWNHWFVTAAALAEGMSWSEAVTFDFDEAFKRHVDYVTIHSRKMFAEWKAEIRRQKDTVRALKADLAEIGKTIGLNEDRARYFIDQISD